MTRSALAVSSGFPLVNSTNIPFKFGPEISEEEFRKIQSKLCLDHFKWDLQIGDVSTLFSQPLLVQAEAWAELKSFAENLSDELFSVERELLDRPELWAPIGIPREIQNVLRETRSRHNTKSAARTLRFDFHYTTEGWRISEVNSDVPGGYAEASAFTAIMASHFPGTRVTGDPASEWANAMLADVERCRNVALLSAPGFLEDQQVTMFLAAKLQERGVQTHLLHHPQHLKWKDGHASMFANNASVALDAIVRFYQGEWLATLKKNAGWKYFFTSGNTPVSNCGIAIMTESKRLPVLFDCMAANTSSWRRLLPECLDPREPEWAADDGWILKRAFSNTGDSVHFRDSMPEKYWDRIVRESRKNPEGWIVQRRFDPVRIVSNRGLVYPCIGVYTINGATAGVYARVSGDSVVDYSAMDVAFLIDGKDDKGRSA